jgi:signal transduction histidine kinase
VRIVEEALVNARKHSQATDVAVTLSRLDGCWRLVIGDNGQGFDFAGRLSLEELNAAHAGPAVIKERVEAIDGQMWVRSDPGVGSQLDIRVTVQTDD